MKTYASCTPVLGWKHTLDKRTASKASSQKPTQSMCVKRPQSSHRIDLFSHSFEHITQCKLIRLRLYAIMYDQLRHNSVFCCPYITLVIRLCYTVSICLWCLNAVPPWLHDKNSVGWVNNWILNNYWSSVTASVQQHKHKSAPPPARSHLRSWLLITNHCPQRR